MLESQLEAKCQSAQWLVRGRDDSALSGVTQVTIVLSLERPTSPNGSFAIRAPDAAK